MSAAAPGSVFVVGCPRSGTYLMSLIVASEFDLAIPVETHFIPLFVPYLPLFGNLRDQRNRRRLLECIYDFLEIWTPRSEREREPEVIRRHSLLATHGSSVDPAAATTSYAQLVDALFGEYARLHGAGGYGDKSAFFRHIALERIDSCVPNLKVVHVIRDGRDVTASWLDAWTGPVNLEQAAATWASHVRAKRAWGRRNPDRYCEVRYEDLLADPSATLDRIGRFLVRPRRGGPLAFHTSELAAALATGAPHNKVAQPLDPSNCGKWRTRMLETEQQMFEFVAGATLTACGYERRFAQLSLQRRAHLALLGGWRRIRARASLHELQIQAKGLLPLVLLACRWVHIPLVSLLNRRHPSFDRRRR